LAGEDLGFARFHRFGFLMALLSFLIPSKDRHDSLSRTLVTLLPAAGRMGAGIVICDQSSRPFSAPPSVVILHRPDLAGLPAARNALLRSTDADIVCFLDDDTTVAGDFGARLSELARREPDVLGWGPVVETRDRRTRRLHRLAHLGAFTDPRRQVARRRDAPTWALFGCCFAVRRAAALTVGFDESRSGYALGEDLDFFARLTARRPILRWSSALRAIHRRDGRDRADPRRRGEMKALFLRWWVRRHGGGNPAAPLHLMLALGAAASGRGDEPGQTLGVLQGMLGRP
jgi:hypothetical protein